jgi:ribA/ribD-fused uncharacterized protein
MRDISFTDVKGDYGWLGNMSPYIVKYKDEWYRTAEALFQCMRYEGFPQVQGEIKAAKSPMNAKWAAKKKENFALIEGRETQEERERNDLCRMRECLLRKLEANPDLKRRLLGTKDARIIEDCTKRPRGSGIFWGMARIEKMQPDGTTVTNWQGRNELGKLWMAIRDELQHQLG